MKEKRLESDKFIVIVDNGITFINALVPSADKFITPDGLRHALKVHPDTLGYNLTALDRQKIFEFLTQNWNWSGGVGVAIDKADTIEEESSPFDKMVWQLINDLKPQFDKAVVEGINLSEIYFRCLNLIPASQAWENKVNEVRNELSNSIVESITNDITLEVVDKIPMELDNRSQVFEGLKTKIYEGGDPNESR